MRVISLLTDFGTRDEYVGVIKGVILARNPQAVVVDISHAVAPQDVLGAAHMLKAAYPYFPHATVHVVVVDPGVGGRRAIVALALEDGPLFLAPDNGVLTPILLDARPQEVVRVENPAFFLDRISRTFHGRDIFAPVAAAIASGVPLRRLGPPMAPGDLVRIDLLAARRDGANAVSGIIVGVDRFGNLITNIDAALLAAAPHPHVQVRIGAHRIQGLAATYEAAAPQRALALIGSRGTLEIAINCGNAAETLSVGTGATVRVDWPEGAGDTPADPGHR
jgi:S-adenosylmethionine hydrolase